MNIHAINSQDAVPAESEAASPLPLLERSVGSAEITFKKRDGLTVLDHLYQRGACKIRFPKEDGLTQAVVINTSGGLTDFDKMDVSVHWRSGTSAVVTTQAAEKIYKSRGGPAHIINSLTIEKDARAIWAPQETILFDKGQVNRDFSAEIKQGGSLVAIESLVFGRTAMGEKASYGAIRDKWRIRYDGRLVFADRLLLSGDLQQQLKSPAVLNGAHSCATLVYVGEAPDQLGDSLQKVLPQIRSFAGFSIQENLVVMRLVSGDSLQLRLDIAEIFAKILTQDTGYKNLQGADLLPRVWSC